MSQEEVDRVQEFRKCIECFLCQDVCHVLRDHDMKEGEMFGGPRFMIRVASLEMHPLDTADRLGLLERHAEHRPVQHHQVLHGSLSRAYPHHGQRHHPA